MRKVLEINGRTAPYIGSMCSSCKLNLSNTKMIVVDSFNIYRSDVKGIAGVEGIPSVYLA